jgi:hypothetical protein
MSDQEASAVSSCLLWGLCGTSYAPIPWDAPTHALAARSQVLLVHRSNNIFGMTVEKLQ